MVGISNNRAKIKRAIALDVTRKKLIEIMDILKKTNYVFQHPKIEDENGFIFAEHLDAFLRKTFNNYDLKSQDEKEFFRIAEAIRSLAVLLSNNEPVLSLV